LGFPFFDTKNGKPKKN